MAHSTFQLLQELVASQSGKCTLTVSRYGRATLNETPIVNTRNDCMALQKRREPALDALIRKAAAEVVRRNPHIGAPAPSYAQEELAEIERLDAEMARLWDSPDGQRAVQLGYSASDAVDEDRGE